MNAPFLACMLTVAAFYHLPPRVLPSIQVVEGGRIGMVHRNSDGSDDLGLMQVNDRWVPLLASYVRLPQPIIRDRLIRSPCFNIATAGAVLRISLNETRGDLMRAIGDYNSHTPSHNLAYRAKVLRAAERLFGHVDTVSGAPMNQFHR